LLEDPSRLQGLSVLRLDQRESPPVHLPRLGGLRVLTKSTLLTAMLPAVGLGLLVGAFVRSSNGIGWIFALLLSSAVVTAFAQQTLP